VSFIRFIFLFPPFLCGFGVSSAFPSYAHWTGKGEKKPLPNNKQGFGGFIKKDLFETGLHIRFILVAGMMA